MSPQRRDAVGRPQTAHSWESLVERQIREAMDQGVRGAARPGRRVVGAHEALVAAARFVAAFEAPG